MGWSLYKRKETLGSSLSPLRVHGEKTTWRPSERTAVYKAGVSLDLSLLTSETVSKHLLFKPPSLVLCYGSWSRLVNTSTIERSTHTNLEKMNAARLKRWTLGVLVPRNLKYPGGFHFQKRIEILSVCPHISESYPTSTVEATVAHSGPHPQGDVTICTGWQGRACFYSLNQPSSVSSILVWHFSPYLLQTIYLSPFTPLSPPSTMAPSCFTLSTDITHPQL